MSLRIPDKVEKLRKALHAKAKRSPEYRFYMLYDKIYRSDVLEASYRRCRSNGGVPGVDGQRFEDIKAYGVERWLGELAGAVDAYAFHRIRQWWVRKHKIRNKRSPRFSQEYLYQQSGLFRLRDMSIHATSAKA